MLEQLLARATRDREQANTARRLGATAAISARYFWAVSKWALFAFAVTVLAVCWVVLSILLQPLRGKR